MLKTWCSVFLKEYKLQSTMLQEQVTLPWNNVMNLIAHPEMRPQWNEVMLCLCERIFVLETNFYMCIISLNRSLSNLSKPLKCSICACVNEALQKGLRTEWSLWDCKWALFIKLFGNETKDCLSLVLHKPSSLTSILEHHIFGIF